MDVFDITFGTSDGQRIVGIRVCYPMIEGMQGLRSAVLMRNHVSYAVVDSCNCPSKGCQYAVVLDEIDILHWIAHRFCGIAEFYHVLHAFTSALLRDVDAVRV